VIVGCLRFRPLAGEPPVAGEFIRLDGTVVMSNVLWANGCAFSPDGLTFYGCDYQRGLVLAADRTSDGKYVAARTAAVSPSRAADGLAIDEDGCLWLALGPRASVARFTPDGNLDAEVPVDADFVRKRVLRWCRPSRARHHDRRQRCGPRGPRRPVRHPRAGRWSGPPHGHGLTGFQEPPTR